MGSYLVVNGYENNSKAISYPMIDLMREVLPDKKSLTGEEVFAMTKTEIAEVLSVCVPLARNEGGITDMYIEQNPDGYGLNKETDEVMRTFSTIEGILARVLSDMVIEGDNAVVCEWV